MSVDKLVEGRAKAAEIRSRRLRIGLQLPAMVRICLVLAFISGIGGLTYEIIWVRQLSHVLGSSMEAISTVLAAFMGGLTLGSIWIGRHADRRIHPLRLYAYLEVGIALYALAFPWILDSVAAANVAAYQMLGGDGWPFRLARASIAIAILLVPTTLMGGTTPALGRWLVRTKEGVGRYLGGVYAVNTAGATVGCFLTGFLFIEKLGVRGATWVAISANLIAGVGALALAARSSWTPKEIPEPETGFARRPPRLRWALLSVAALSGFAALGYEVVWTRYLVFFLADSTYAFTVMLGTFLTGLAVGAALISRVADRIRRPALWVALLEVGVVVSTVLCIWIYIHMPDLIRLAHGGAPPVAQTITTAIPPPPRPPVTASWAVWIIKKVVQASLTLLPTTLLLGAIFPLMLRLMIDDLRHVGRDTGLLYAANTCGAVAGSLMTGFVLIGALGFRGAAITLMGVSVLAALVTAQAYRILPLPATLAGSLAVLVGVQAVLPARIFTRAFHRMHPGLELVALAETQSATLFVTQDPDGDRWLHFSDARGSGGSKNMPGEKMWAHLPLLLHARPDSSLSICFGSGTTLGAVGRHDLERIDCAEICRGIDAIAGYFPENRNILSDPRVHMIYDDGRNFLRVTPQTYDMISSEPPLLESAGVVHLYTREFYDLAKARLRPGGIMCQYLPSFEFEMSDQLALIRSFLDVFPHVTYWGSPLYADTILLGTRNPLRIDVGDLVQRMDSPPIREDLEEMGIFSVYDLLSYYSLGDEELRRLTAASVPITDDRTVLDFRLPRLLLTPRDAAPMFLWKRYLAMDSDILSMQVGSSVMDAIDPTTIPHDLLPDFEDRMKRFHHAKSLVIQGHIQVSRGGEAAAEALFRQAHTVASSYTNGRYYLAWSLLGKARRQMESGNREKAAQAFAEAEAVAPNLGALPVELQRVAALLQVSVAADLSSSSRAEAQPTPADR